MLNVPHDIHRQMGKEKTRAEVVTSFSSLSNTFFFAELTSLTQRKLIEMTPILNPCECCTNDAYVTALFDSHFRFICAVRKVTILFFVYCLNF